MSCEQHESELREVQRQREVLADALAYFVLMFGETPDGEWPAQIMEDPSTMTGSLECARTALRAIGRTP